MPSFSPHHGWSTLVIHAEEGANPEHAHITPIYQTSTFSFPDTKSGAAILRGEQPGFAYTRTGNPNVAQLARKIAILEGLDLLRQQPDREVDELLAGRMFASGMAAISSAILARTGAGDTIIAQQALYGNAYAFLNEVAPRFGIQVIWVTNTSPQGWATAFRSHPEARLVYAETPVNPTMQLVDLEAIAEIAHQHNSWLFVDNTFATPYCQRPLALGADVVIHSTTKYLSGHGVIIGGAVISTHLDFMRGPMRQIIKLLGAAPSPFDAWLTNLGLKTFELRMQRHCTNAMAVARFLEQHPKVTRVNYPGLESNPGHTLATQQMDHYGGMLSFELKGGLEAGVKLLENVHLATLAVSLGNVDTLIQQPASMTHRSVPPVERMKMGISDGLVRLSVGVENEADIIEDLDQALSVVSGG
jgi:methionine-gamma-lyase